MSQLRSNADGDGDNVMIKVTRVVRMTEKAVLVVVGTGEVWIPLSQLQEGSDEPEEGDGKLVLVIPRWLADEKSIH